jgi:exo-beta-1,3-glucanase (GH17 family)
VSHHYKSIVLALLLATYANLFGAPPVIKETLTINNKLGANFQIGDTWGLALTGADADTPFSICANINGAAGFCTPNFGTTDANGQWQDFGYFDSSAAGQWSEWLEFPSGTISNRISFTVGTPPIPRLTLNSATGGNFTTGQSWNLTLTNGPPNAPFTICSSIDLNAQSCTPNFGATDTNGSWQLSGVFDVSTYGGRVEWLEFPSSVATSSLISFTVGTFPTSPLTSTAVPLYGIAFRPYVADQDPNDNVTITETQIRERLSLIAPFTSWILTYGSTHGLEKIPEIAHSLGLRVAVGIWLNNDPAANEEEMGNGIAIAQQGYADVLVVGNEALLRGDLTAGQLLGYFTQVRQLVPGVKITTGEIPWTLIQNPQVAEACDVLFAHYYPGPGGDGVDIDHALSQFVMDDAYLRNQYPGKEVVIGETGWPSNGVSIGAPTDPSPTNAAFYFQNFVAWARQSNRKYFYFEAFDELWKGIYPDSLYFIPQESHFGIWNENGTLKPGMSNAFLSTIPAPCAEAVGGPGTPAVQFTSVPPKGSSDSLVGNVSHIVPADNYVAAFIHVEGGWWTKPYWSSPETLIGCDGTWTTDITTGGDDPQADQIIAFVLPANFQVPLAYGGALDASIPSNAIAQISVTR